MHYLIGTIQEISKNKIVLETSNSIGYQFSYFSFLGEDGFELNNQTVKIYLAEVRTEFETQTFCFKKPENKMLFQELTKIKTVGIQTAKLIMKNFLMEDFLEIVKNNQFDKLQELKNIGSFTAKIIINELQKVFFKITYNSKQLSVIESLQKLGYNQRRIYQAINKIDNNLKIEEMFQMVLGRVVESEQSGV